MGHEKYSLSPVGKESQKALLSPRKGVRQISRTPFKVLDAPELAVSFSSLLLIWGMRGEALVESFAQGTQGFGLGCMMLYMRVAKE